MNLWGTGPFDNDSGKAFIEEVRQDGAYALQEAFDVVLDPDMDWIEAEEGWRVLAAAEVLRTALSGDTSRVVDAGLRAWVQQADVADLAPLRTSARSAVRRVLSQESELPGLWEDEADAQAWRTGAEQLRDALS